MCLSLKQSLISRHWLDLCKVQAGLGHSALLPPSLPLIWSVHYHSLGSHLMVDTWYKHKTKTQVHCHTKSNLASKRSCVLVTLNSAIFFIFFAIFPVLFNCLFISVSQKLFAMKPLLGFCFVYTSPQKSLNLVSAASGPKIIQLL